MFVNKFASLHQLKFSTNVDVSKSKTKYIVFSNPVMNTDNNLPLPYVSEIKHLGSTLQSYGSMTKDVSCAKFISKIHSLNQEFHYVIHPCIKIVWYIYLWFLCSNLWDLYRVGMFKTSWIQGTLLFARETHRYFIEPISNVSYIKSVLCTIVFYNLWPAYQNVLKLCIRLLVDLSKHDLRTVLCKNLESIAQDCNV